MKHIPLNTYISLYGNGAGHGEEEDGILSILADHGLNPEDFVIDRENVEQLEKRMEQELSGFEKQVLDLYITGMSYSQIARVLGRDEKSTDNALQRVKGKIKKMILE